MSKKNNKIKGVPEQIPRKARRRIDGPSVVMRIPGSLEADVRAFIDIVADYINRDSHGEVRELPPARITDAQRRKLCSLLVSLADFETERQRAVRQRAFDRRQLSLFGAEESSEEERAVVCHLLRVNERSFAYTASVQETGCACLPRFSPGISEGDTVFLLVRPRHGRLVLFRMRVEGFGPFPPEYAGYAVRPTLRAKRVCLLRFQGSHRGGEIRVDLLEQQGIRRHTAQQLLSDAQAAWLDGRINNTDHTQVMDRQDVLKP